MITTWVGRLPWVETALFERYRDGRFLLPADPTDADMAQALWRGARLAALEVGPRKTLVLPRHLEAFLSGPLYDHYARRQLVSELAEALTEQYRLRASREGCELSPAGGPPRIEVRREGDEPAAGEATIRVVARWPEAVSASQPGRQAEGDVLGAPPKGTDAVSWGRYLFGHEGEAWRRSLEEALAAGPAGWLPGPEAVRGLCAHEVAVRIGLAVLFRQTASLDPWLRALEGRVPERSELWPFLLAAAEGLGLDHKSATSRLAAPVTRVEAKPRPARLTASLFRLDRRNPGGSHALWVALGRSRLGFSVSGEPLPLDAGPVSWLVELPVDPGVERPVAPAPPDPSWWETWCAREPAWASLCPEGAVRAVLGAVVPSRHRSWHAGSLSESLLATADDVILAGRDPLANDLALASDERVTGVGHFVLVADAADRVRLADLGSRNGTRLNGTPLEALVLHPLADGDSLEVGDTTLVCRAVGAPR